MPIQPSYYRPPSGSIHALRKEVEAALYLEAPWSDVRLAQLARFYKISLLPGCDGNYHIPLVYVDGVICGAPTTTADPERPGLHCRECFLDAADEFENPMRFDAGGYMSREEWDRLIQGYYSKTMNEPATLILISEKERSLREQDHVKKVERWQGLTDATTGATNPVEAPSVSKASRNPRVRPARAPKPTWGSQVVTAADGWEFLGFDPGPKNTYWARVLVTPAGCKYITGGRIYSDVGSIALVLAKSDPKMIGIEEVGNFVKPEARIQLKDTAKVVGLIEGVAGAMGYKSMLITANGPSSWRKVLTGNAHAGDLLVGEAVVATPNFPPRSNNHLRDATGIAMVTGMLYAEPEKYGNI